jgi:hypothetical protein
MKVHQTEIFGPVVVILKADTLDEAIIRTGIADVDFLYIVCILLANT